MKNVFGCFLKVINAKIKFSNFEKITYSLNKNSFYSGLNLFDITNSELFVKEINIVNAV